MESRRVAFSVTIEALPAGIVAHVAGPTNLDNMRMLVDRLDSALRFHRAHTVIVDCARMNGALSLGELYTVGEMFAALAARTRARMGAYDMPPDWRDNDFAEEVMRNRGAALRHFPTREAALAWMDYSSK